MEQQELAKVLSLYGEMNPRPCAYSIKFRYSYNQYTSKDENMRQNTVDNTRYNVVLYGFKVYSDLSENMSMGFMFLNLIQMKRTIRHTWIDSAGQPQFVIISENNRPIPPNLLYQLLWSQEDKEKNQEIQTRIDVVSPNVSSPVTKLPLDDILEEKRRLDKLLDKELRNEMLSQSTEQAKCSCWLLNSIRRRQDKEETDAEALQAAQHAYLVNWAKVKEEHM